MTESEIMKALECCKAYNYDACSECPFNRNADCAFAVATNCLDLINRKNAEIERLTVNMNAFGLGMKRENERAETARAEAIKEFAERVKEAGAKSVEVAFYGNGTETIEFITLRTNLVDQIAKEMGVEL